MKRNVLNIWVPGQLLVWSGLDGKTDYANGLILRTAFESAAFDIRWPEDSGQIRFQTGELAGELLLTGDCFRIGKLRGAFVDTWHVLFEGDFQFAVGDKVKVLSAGNKHLIGAANFFSPKLIDMDIETVIAARLHGLQKLSIPFALPENVERTLWRTWSQ